MAKCVGEVRVFAIQLASKQSSSNAFLLTIFVTKILLAQFSARDLFSHLAAKRDFVYTARDLTRPTEMPSPPFDQALQALIKAIAHYYRCGAEYRSRSEVFWLFVAGSYTRQQYEDAVRGALNLLPDMKSVEHDLRSARGLVVQAVKLLGGVDER